MPDSLFDDADSSPTPTKISATELLDMWNAAARDAGMHPARTLGDVGSPRYRRVTNLVKRHPSRDYWREVIERIARSGFCTGKVASHGGRT